MRLLRSLIPVILGLHLAAPASAQEVPSLFRVTGVAYDDVLNVRADPNANALDIGDLAADQRGVEVTELSPDRAWGRINYAETPGWVAMRYLAEEAGVLDEDGWPRRLQCFGTEPFWGFDFDAPDRMSFAEHDVEYELYEVTEFDEPALSRSHRAAQGVRADKVLNVILTRAECSDGMSDRLNAISISLLLTSPEFRLYTGCCRIAAPE